MLKWLNNNIYSLGVVFILLITSYFFFVEDTKAPEIISAILVMTILSIFVLGNKKIAIYSIIALAPISIPIYVEVLSLKLSFPSEFVTVLLIITMGSSFFVNEKFSRKILFHPISIILLIDIFFTLIAASFSTMPLISFKRFLLKTGFISIYYFVFSHWYNNQSDKNKYTLFFLYAIGFIYPIYNTLKWHSLQDFSVAASFAMPQPFYSDHTIYGACLAFVIPFLIAWLYSNYKEKNKWFIPVLLLTILIFVAEIIAYSRAAWISLLVIVLFRILLNFKLKINHILIGISIIFAGIVYNYEDLFNQIKQQEQQTAEEENVTNHLSTVTNLQTDASNLERINRWTCAYRMFVERPFTGFGPGTYQFQYGKFQSVDLMTRISTHEGNKGHAHSEYFTYLSEIGIFGLLTFLTLVLYSIHIGLKCYYFFKQDQIKRILIFGALGGLLTFYVHGLFNGFIDYEKMAILVYGCLALLVIFDIERRKTDLTD